MAITRRFPFARLVLRPATWIAFLFQCYLFGSMAVNLDRFAAVVALIRSGPLTPDAELGLCHLAAILPAGIALVVTFATMQLMSGAFAWTLPRLQERFLAGLAVTGLLASAVVMALFSLHGLFAEAAASLGVGLLAFAGGGAIFRTAAARQALVRGGLVGLGAWFAPWVGTTTVAWPVPAIAIGSALLALIHRQAYSRDATRRMYDLEQSFRVNPDRGLLRWIMPGHGQWNRSLTTGRLFEWIRAAEYEVQGGFRITPVVALLIWVTFWTVVTVLLETGSSFLWLGFVLIMVSHSSGGVSALRRGGAYPLSRKARASVTYWGGVFWVVRALVIVGGLFALLVTILPSARDLRFEKQRQLLTFAASVWVMSPFAYWASVRYAPVTFSPIAIAKPMMGQLATLGGGAAVTYVIVESGITESTAALYGVLAALTLAVQVVVWFAMRHHFLRADLA